MTHLLLLLLLLLLHPLLVAAQPVFVGTDSCSSPRISATTFVVGCAEYPEDNSSTRFSCTGKVDYDGAGCEGETRGSFTNSQCSPENQNTSLVCVDTPILTALIYGDETCANQTESGYYVTTTRCMSISGSSPYFLFDVEGSNASVTVFSDADCEEVAIANESIPFDECYEFPPDSGTFIKVHNGYIPPDGPGSSPTIAATAAALVAIATAWLTVSA